jgi:hypothetical protein
VLFHFGWRADSFMGKTRIHLTPWAVADRAVRLADVGISPRAVAGPAVRASTPDHPAPLLPEAELTTALGAGGEENDYLVALPFSKPVQVTIAAFPAGSEPPFELWHRDELLRRDRRARMVLTPPAADLYTLRVGKSAAATAYQIIVTYDHPYEPSFEIRVGEASVSTGSGLAAREISETVSFQRANMQVWCADAAGAGPSPSEMVARIHVEETGKIASVTVRGASQKLDDCIADVVRRNQYPSASAATEAEVPIAFVRYPVP